MEQAARSQIHYTVFGQAFALKFHDTSCHLLAGYRVNDALACRARNLDFFLRVQSSVALRADKQRADQATFSP